VLRRETERRNSSTVKMRSKPPVNVKIIGQEHRAELDLAARGERDSDLTARGERYFAAL
jgi:hypothetical protein